MRRELRELQGDMQAEALYIEGLHALMNSGYLNALRAEGRPTRYNSGKDSNQMASEAAWSAGWNDCLDALIHFREIYFQTAPEAAKTADFGALDLALLKGDVTKEEFDARKSTGHYEPPALNTVTNNIKLPTRPDS